MGGEFQGGEGVKAVGSKEEGGQSRGVHSMRLEFLPKRVTEVSKILQSYLLQSSLGQRKPIDKKINNKEAERK